MYTPFPNTEENMLAMSLKKEKDSFSDNCRCVAGPDLLPLCFDWVSRSCQHTFKSKSFSVAYLFGSSSQQNLIYQEGILRLIIFFLQKVRRKWLIHLRNKVRAVQLFVFFGAFSNNGPEDGRMCWN